MTVKLDYVEVSRIAHEFSETHGLRAHTYTAKLAREAFAEGAADEHAFWRAVEAALRPRQTPD